MDSNHAKPKEHRDQVSLNRQNDKKLHLTNVQKQASPQNIDSNQISDDLKLSNQRHLAKSCNCIVLNESKSTKSISSSDSEESSDDNKSRAKSRSSRNLVTPPDGGWGWIIVFTSFLINLIADGITASFGLVFIVLSDYFKQSKSKTAWVGSLFISMPLLTGPLASALTNRYGCRKVTIVSGLLAASGFILGYFATRLEHLFVAFSISGFGLSLCFVTSIVIVAYYFEKRRSLSTGLAVCGTGVGASIFAPLTTYFLKTFSWRGTLLIFSGFFLNIIVFGAFMRDLEVNEESTVTLSECDYSAQTNQELPINNNTSLLPNLSSFIRKYRNFSSLVDIPTFIRNDSSFKVSNSSFDATNSSSHGFKEVDTLDRQNKKQCKKSIQKATDESTLIQKSQLESKTNNQERQDLKPNQMNKRSAKRRKHMSYRCSLDQHELPGNAVSKRQSRISITYRSAMLSMRLCMASSAPDLYHRTSISKRKVENAKSIWKEFKSMLRNLIDFSVFKSFRFSLFCFSNLLLSAFIETPYIYLPDHASSFGEHNKDLASYLISIIGIVNTLGTVITGYIGDKPWVSPSTLYGVLTAFSGIALALIPMVKSFQNLAILGALFGFSISANYSLVSAILVDLISLDKFTHAYGLLLLVQGVASLIGPPFAGWLRDISGNYDITFIVSGICIFISGIIIIPVTSKVQAADSCTIVSSSRPSSPNESKTSNLVTHNCCQHSQDRLINY